MGQIKDIAQLSIKGNAIYHDNKKVGKWWGKTLYSINKDGSLEYKSFSPIALIFHHAFGYKKEFNKRALKDWLVSKKIQLPKDTTKKVEIQALQLLQEQRKQFKALCIFENKNSAQSDQEIIQLFKNGLDVNYIIDSCNTSVLQSACYHGRTEVVKYLLENGADVNIQSTPESGLTNQTPLQHAVSAGNKELVLLLLQNGANATAVNYDVQSVLQIAINNLRRSDKLQESKEIIKEVLSRGEASVNICDRNGRSPLYSACELGDLEVVQWLLDSKADVNAYGQYNSPALFPAIHKGNVDVVDLLIAKGANTDPESHDKYSVTWETPLRLALGAYNISDEWKPDPEMIKLLYKNNADANKVGGYKKEAPLHLAVRRKDIDSIKLLVKLGADPQVKDSKGKTPLELAQAEGYAEVARFIETLM